PVLHANEDWQPELALQAGALGLRDLVERRAAADSPVALAQLLDRLLRDRTVLANVGEVSGHVVSRHRASVRHQDHGCLHTATVAVRSCTSSTNRDRSAGSVSGNTPCPRLKTWPDRPPARARTSSASRSTRSHGPSRTAPSRFRWMPRSWPTRSRAASSGRRQSA